MSEKFTSSEQPTPKKKIETKQDPNGFWGKNVYEIRQKVEKLNKPEAKEFFDFWWLITENKNGTRKLDMSTDHRNLYDKSNGVRKTIPNKNKAVVREDTVTDYQTFKGDTLTIMVNVRGDLNIDDDEQQIDTKKFPNWKNEYDINSFYADKFEPDGSQTPMTSYDVTSTGLATKIQLSPTGSITLWTKEAVTGGIKMADIWSKPIIIDGKRAADFIIQLKKKFLERFVNRQPDRGITDNELNDVLDKHGNDK